MINENQFFNKQKKNGENSRGKFSAEKINNTKRIENSVNLCNYIVTVFVFVSVLQIHDHRIVDQLRA